MIEKKTSRLKILRAGIESRKIDLLKKAKAKLGFPKKIPNFMEEITKVIDGNGKAK
jgi:hypothetical protein